MPVVQQLIAELPANPLLFLAIVPAGFVLICLLDYFKVHSDLRRYPGPILAKFTDAWIFWAISQNRWADTVDRLHKEHGTFVRIAPNHVSISDPRAIHTIYGHSTNFLKSGFYDVFANFPIRSVFRSRAEHTRKRRFMAHAFAPQSIRAIEPLAQVHTAELLRQWDYLVSNVKEAQHGTGPLSGKLGSSEWTVHDGSVWFDCMMWLNFWSFDTIGDLAFGLPFGMLKSGKDTARVAKSAEEGFRAIEKITACADTLALETEDIPWIKTLSTRAETNGPLAFLSPTWQRIVQRLPHYNNYPVSGKKLGAMAVMSIARRMANPDARPDMLQKLLDARDDNGNPLSPVELASEAMVFIVAGSDTIANTTCAVSFYLAHNPDIQAKLQAELDVALASVDTDVVPYELVKNLPYLEAVIHEGQRLYSTIGAGLPRAVPAGGADICGHHFKEGTVVSVPGYHIHRDEAAWGPDAALFRPERWIEATAERKKEMMDVFIPFSVGPRACIGRALAIQQLHVILATLFRRYDFTIKPGAKLEVRDAFVRRPVECVVGIKARKV